MNQFWKRGAEVAERQNILGADFFAESAIGRSRGYTTQFITARDDDIDANDGLGTIWHAPQDTWMPPLLPLVMDYDEAADTGKAIILRGLDLLGSWRVEQTTVGTPLDGNWSRIFNMSLTSTDANEGDIWIEDQNGDYEDFMSEGESFSYTGAFQVPSDRIGLIPYANVSTRAYHPARLRVYLSAHFPGTPPKKFIELHEGYNEFRTPLYFPAGVLVYFQAESIQGNNHYASVFSNIILIDPEECPVGVPIGGVFSPQ
jgi:hypothetical protein